MPNIEGWVTERLLAAEDVTDLVGERIYPVTYPQGKDNLPALVYFRTGTFRQYTNLQNDQRPQTTIRIFAVSRSYKESKDILDVVRPLFDGYTGINASAHAVSRAVISDEADDFEAPAFGDEVVIYKPFIDVEIRHKE